MSRLVRLLPIIVAVLAAAWLVRSSTPPRDSSDESAFRVQAFGALPVVYQGRVKPFDTLARNSLVIISDRQYWKDTDGDRRLAIEWLLDVMSGSPRAEQHVVFRVHNHELLSQLGLERRKGYRYSFAELVPHLLEIESQAARASRLEAGQRDAYDTQVLELYQKVVLYRILGETHAIPHLDDDGGGLREAMQVLEQIERFNLPHAIPPRSDHEEETDWTPMLRAVLNGAITGEPHAIVQPLAGVMFAWASGDAASFNTAVAACEAYFVQNPIQEHSALSFEQAFNHAVPFYRCSVLYIFALVLGFMSWLGWAEALRRTAFSLLATTFVAHTIAIGARVYISGYPPITNLYGTAVFIGWGCVLLGLILEMIYKLGTGNLLAAVSGFLTLLVAHFLAGDGDTLEMMQAVLDTKFWLATHVIIINFGYSATFLAGGLAVAYVLRGVLTKSLTADVDKAFGRMIYGVLCFALLLSFLGTVLGGLWADDSWGRFWGWDPKENGALMIVLWNALILHARWGGVVRTRGIAVLSLFGNVITAWSWFGVNQLGVGLHSYGFTSSVAFWLIIFGGSQIALMAVGMIPRRFWRSPMTTRGGQGSSGGGKSPKSPADAEGMLAREPGAKGSPGSAKG